jgi:formylglycine-generating enzyme required for sulfatase activity
MTENPKLLSILSDQPADRDQLSFAPYAKTLADIIADPGTDTPLTIGVFGGWGRGKTSLMQMVRRRLEETAATDFPVHPVWFNAWLYSREQALWRALISRVLQGARGFELGERALDQMRQLEARLYQAAEATCGQLTLPPGMVPSQASVALPAPAGFELLRRQSQRGGEDLEQLEALIDDVEVSQALTRRDQIAALDDFRRQFEAISRDCILPNGRLAVFVDDLDRCLPDKAVEVLEAVKLFLDVPGCVFVMGVDRQVIEEGIAVRYSDYETEIRGDHYLEKIIQIPFSLPPIPPTAVEEYVHQVTAGNLPDERCETVFSVGLEPNPRRIKRTLNIFLLLWRLSQNREDLGDAIKPVRLAKIVIIQQYHPRLFALLLEGGHYLIDLERRFREAEQAKDEEFDTGERRIPREGSPLSSQERGTGGEVSAGPLSEFLGRGLLRDLLTCTAVDEADANFAGPQGLTPAGVREYVYLTRSTVEEETVEEEATRLPFEPQMVTVPAGPFLMGTPESEVDELFNLLKKETERAKREWVEKEAPQHEVTLDGYAIARYPVTNADFGRFIEDGGYETREYWTDAGWKQKESDGWTQPRYWEDEKWNDPSQPVVGVSWYEALAYCRWLSARSGRDYRLPTEAQWEKAARGSDGRRYPWGDDWDPARCNNEESGPGHTTPVGQYPEGDSPYGVSEMVGQVWEWCSSKYGGAEAKPRFGYPYNAEDEREELEGDDTRILRGGSWYNGAGRCRCAYRLRGNPWLGGGDRGFRCVRILSS